MPNIYRRESGVYSVGHRRAGTWLLLLSKCVLPLGLLADELFRGVKHEAQGPQSVRERLQSSPLDKMVPVFLLFTTEMSVSIPNRKKCQKTNFFCNFTHLTSFTGSVHFRLKWAVCSLWCKMTLCVSSRWIMNLTTFSLYFSAAGSIHKFSLLCCVGSLFIHAYFYITSPALFDSRVVTIARFYYACDFFKMR